MTNRHWATSALAALFFSTMIGACAADGIEPLSVEATPVPLKPDEPALTTAGTLTYRGGVELTSPSRRFGGISGLWVDPSSDSGGHRTVMITDQGYWIDALLRMDDGQVTGIEDARMGPMLDTRGRSIAGKARGDAEALLRWDDGFLVSFERDHRIWRYPAPDSRAPFEARPEPVPLPDDFGDVPNNNGLESMARAGANLVILTEGAKDEAANIRGWVGGPDGTSFRPLTLQGRAPFMPTDLAGLPGGGLVTVERFYSPVTGTMIQLRRIPGTAVEPGAVMDGPTLAAFDSTYTIDNMEGLSAVPLDADKVRLFLISDDNFNTAQRTLLLTFDLDL